MQVVDWDKLEAEVKDEEKNEQLDGDAGVNRLFQQIYAGVLAASCGVIDRCPGSITGVLGIGSTLLPTCHV